MIPKEDRDRDRAICEAATKGPWRAGNTSRGDAGDVEVFAPDGSEICLCWPDRKAENASAIANAVNRLPAYIAALDEMEGRITALEEAARRHETGEIRIDAEGRLPPEVGRALDDMAAAVLRLAVSILRGDS